MKVIDPHVHLRGIEYREPFCKWAGEDCVACGISAVGEMPNPEPNLTTPEAIKARLKEGFPINRWINAGITISGIKQLLLHPSLKVFWCHSTGDMGIVDPRDQKYVWRALAGYRCIVMQHCEDSTMWRGEYDVLNPITHSWRQNPESEFVCVEQQLKNAIDVGFKGVFYVCHVSTPQTLDLLETYRRRVEFTIIAEVTWHHLFLNTLEYSWSGNLVKMNPPLRSPALQTGLLDRVLRGYAQIIGSDHAPHSLDRKRAGASGIPALPFWPRGIDLLRRHGIAEEYLHRMCYKSAELLFNTRAQTELKSYDPKLWDKYGWNPFERIDREYQNGTSTTG